MRERREAVVGETLARVQGIMRRPVARAALMAVALTFILFAGCAGDERDVIAPVGRKVALYADHGCWPSSITAASKMFEWMGLAVTKVDAATINSGGLAGYDLFCVPGGDMYRYSQSITSSGKERIRDFVAQGGAYVGICGGAYFAGERVFWRGQQLPMAPLGLYRGYARGPIDEIAPYPDSTMCRIDLAGESHPITAAIPDSAWVLYYWGPALFPEDENAVAAIGRYTIGGAAAALAFDFGAGRVFIIGAHPEIEEDSDRDGVGELDVLEDRGSDWDLMRAVVRWCVRE